MAPLKSQSSCSLVLIRQHRSRKRFFRIARIKTKIPKPMARIKLAGFSHLFKGQDPLVNTGDLAWLSKEIIRSVTGRCRHLSSYRQLE